MPLISKGEKLKGLIKELINRQIKYDLLDPNVNIFYKNNSKVTH